MILRTQERPCTDFLVVLAAAFVDVVFATLLAAVLALVLTDVFLVVFALVVVVVFLLVLIRRFATTGATRGDSVTDEMAEEALVATTSEEAVADELIRFWFADTEACEHNV